MQPKREASKKPDFSLEKLHKNVVIGIDEAGRGPIAGPVVAACALLDENNFAQGINDSKMLSKLARKKIFLEIQKKVKFGIGIVDEKIIDEINILQATKLAMLRAYENFCAKYEIFPETILVDGNFSPFELRDKIKKILPIIKGDQKSFSIAAASIIAKETRDQMMLEIHQKYPIFGFEKHAGYPTKFHVKQIAEFGICEFHRKSFEPIKSMFPC
jgi:ribonuclease HII